MKKTEFTFLQGAEDRLHAIDAGKMEDYDLPEFSKEVPVSSRKSTSGENASVEYEWKDTKSEMVRIRRIDFRKGEEDLFELYRIPARDGADSICFKHKDTTYIMRKTMKEVAQALYNAYGKVKGGLENIVGYLRSVLGNCYVIAKVERDSWAFDKRIAKHGVNYTEVDNLDRKEKTRLCELVVEAIADLHLSNLIMGRFTLNNVILHEDQIRLTDLRKLRASRKRSFVVEEFKSILQYLFAIGIATREDVYAAIVYYAAHNEKGCAEWYFEKTNKEPSDELDIAGRIEEEVYS